MLLTSPRPLPEAMYSVLPYDGPQGVLRAFEAYVTVQGIATVRNCFTSSIAGEANVALAGDATYPARVRRRTFHKSLKSSRVCVCVCVCVYGIFERSAWSRDTLRYWIGLDGP